MVPRDVTTFDAATDRPSQHSLRGLDWLNFLLAGALGGFGPLVAVYLAGRHWTQGEIGLILTASGVAGILSQVPGGELLDRVRSKRFVVALGVAMILISAGILTLWPSFPLVFTAEVVRVRPVGFSDRRFPRSALDWLDMRRCLSDSGAINALRPSVGSLRQGSWVCSVTSFRTK